ncbi:hypothetical protein B0H13DRAFT_1855167 [Mycena leptocephala]|nr:hypothetical protein B0H13DRAFT_1855167 [Mycena leptocephala]
MSVIYEQKSSGMCKAIRAISHMFAHSKKAIRWLIWLVRNLSNSANQPPFNPYNYAPAGDPWAETLPPPLMEHPQSDLLQGIHGMLQGLVDRVSALEVTVANAALTSAPARSLPHLISPRYRDIWWADPKSLLRYLWGILIWKEYYKIQGIMCYGWVTL